MKEIVFPFELLAVSEAVATARTPVITRSHYEACTVEYVSSGGGFLSINGENFHPVQDSVYFLHIGSDHSYWPDRSDPWSKQFFVINGPLVQILFQAYGLQNVYHVPDCPSLKKYFAEMNELNGSPHEASLLFHAFVGEAAKLFYAPERKADGIAVRLKRALDKSLRETFSLTGYGMQNHISQVALIRNFRKEYGVTPYEYLLEQRIESAARLLLYSTLSVKEIAEELVFSDQYYFSNFFKKKKGVSPENFRKNFQKSH